VFVMTCASGEWRAPLALRPAFCSSSREITKRYLESDRETHQLNSVSPRQDFG
jgi:hypothetical protein